MTVKNFHLVAGALVALLGLATAANAREVTVRINRVAQIDNLDKFDVDPDRADFYAQIWINGQLHRTKNFSFDDGKPYWTFSRNVSTRYVKIRIKLLDDDGGLEEADDFVDINRRKGKKDLHFVLDTRTGRITGDVRGRRRQTIYSYGEGDTDQGKIWFTVM
jgi:hypothetical protein